MVFYEIYLECNQYWQNDTELNQYWQNDWVHLAPVPILIIYDIIQLPTTIDILIIIHSKCQGQVAYQILFFLDTSNLFLLEIHFSSQ